MDVNFDYGSSSSASGSRGGGDRDRNRRSKARNNEEQRRQREPSRGGPTLSDSDFPNINGTPSSAPRQQVSKSGATSSSSKGIRRPVGFGSLSENWPSLGEDPRTQSSSSRTESSSSSQAAAAAGGASSSSASSKEPEVVSRHAAFLERIFDMLKSHEKVAQFRRFTTSYRNNEMDVDTYVDNIVDLCDANTDHVSKIIKGVEDLMDNQEKKWEIVRAWRNKQTAVSNFDIGTQDDGFLIGFYR